MSAVPLALADVRSPRLLELHYQALTCGWTAVLHTEATWPTDDGVEVDESATFERTRPADVTLHVFANRAGQPDETIVGVARIGLAPVVTRLFNDFAPIAVALHELAVAS